MADPNNGSSFKAALVTILSPALGGLAAWTLLSVNELTGDVKAQSVRMDGQEKQIDGVDRRIEALEGNIDKISIARCVDLSSR